MGEKMDDKEEGSSFIVSFVTRISMPMEKCQLK